MCSLFCRCYRFVFLFSAVSLSAGHARAEPERYKTHLEIDRAAGSEQCPDVQAVFRAITRLFPEGSVQKSNTLNESVARARITIRPTARGHEALVLNILPRTGERTLIDDDVNCTGLAEAVAVTLVLLIKPPEQKARATTNPLPVATTGELPPPIVLDASVTTTSKPNEGATDEPVAYGPVAKNTTAAKPIAVKPVAKNTTAAQPIAVKPVARKTTTNELVADAPVEQESAIISPAYQSTPVVLPEFEQWKSSQQGAVTISANVAGIGGLGLLSSPAVGGTLGLDLFHRRGWGLTLQGLRLWSKRVEKEGGSVTLTLWGGLIGTCYTQRLAPSSGLDICLQLGFGQQRPSVNGFAKPTSAGVPWAVFGPKLRYNHGLTRLLGAFLGVGATGQLLPQSFSARRDDGTGESVTVADAPRVGLMAELGLRFGGGIH